LEPQEAPDRATSDSQGSILLKLTLGASRLWRALHISRVEAHMQKIVAAFLASSLLFPARSFAQDSKLREGAILGHGSAAAEPRATLRESATRHARLAAMNEASQAPQNAGVPNELASQPSDRVSWDTLPSLRAGMKLRLSLADGSEVVGQLVAAKSDAVVLNRNKVRKGPFTAPSGMSLRDPLTFLHSDVLSVEQDKGWPFWTKALLWIGISWLVAGAIIGSIVGNQS
jgi:hypothetical protein